eukprot:1156469-Pelagomonas_calceolata.AAC.6
MPEWCNNQFREDQEAAEWRKLGCTHGWLKIHLSPFVLIRGGAWQRQRASRFYKYVQQVAAILTTRATNLTSTIRASKTAQQFIVQKPQMHPSSPPGIVDCRL